MADTLPAPLSIEAPDGRVSVLLKEGATLPARTRAVFATQKPNERTLSLKLHEGAAEQDLALVATVDADLPPGLPPNTWLQVFVSVAPDLSIRIEITENLRRLRIDPDLDTSASTASHFSAG